MRRLLTLAAGLMLVAGTYTACRQAQATPIPPPTMQPPVLQAVSGSTFTVKATWQPVIWHGTQITTFRRTITRTDTAQDLSVYGLDVNAALTAPGDSDVVSIPLPDPGPGGTYRYCLRTNATGTLSADSACANFGYTRADTIPPAPSGLQATPDTTGNVALLPDTLHLVMDSLSVAIAGHPNLDSLRIDSTYLALAVWWQGNQPIGCMAASAAHMSDCRQVGITQAPVMVRNGQKLYLAGWDSVTKVATLVPGSAQLSLAMAKLLHVQRLATNLREAWVRPPSSAN